jgi:hypothetical protein
MPDAVVIPEADQSQEGACSRWLIRDAATDEPDGHLPQYGDQQADDPFLKGLESSKG